MYWRYQLKLRNEWKPKYDPEGTEAAVLFFFGLLLLSRRVGFAAFATLLLIAGVGTLSKVKFKYIRMHLHAYDFVYFVKISNIVFFFKNYLSLAVRIFGALLLGVVLIAMLALFERPEVNVYAAGLIFFIALVSLWILIPRLAAAPRLRGYWDWFDGPSNVSKFAKSLVEAIGAWRRGGVLAAVQPTDGFPALMDSVPKLKMRAPNIILILNESTFPPWLHGAVPADPALTDFFRSVDGGLHRLRVETFGGASWISEFSVLTGIPGVVTEPLQPMFFIGRQTRSTRLCRFASNNLAIERE